MTYGAEQLIGQIHTSEVSAVYLLGLFQEGQEQAGGGFPWWIFGCLLIVIVLLGLAWWLKQQATEEPAVSPAEAAPAGSPTESITGTSTAPEETSPTMEASFPTEEEVAEEVPSAEEAEPAAEPAPAVEAEAAAPPAAEEPPEPAPAVEEAPEPDNLTRVEGIGPKISSILQDAGINTFSQLAATEVSRLEEILEKAGLSSLANPATWPDQAKLAAAGDWDGLKKLQDELKGGRRAT